LASPKRPTTQATLPRKPFQSSIAGEIARRWWKALPIPGGPAARDLATPIVEAGPVAGDRINEFFGG
jgi:hypothetical protein